MWPVLAFIALVSLVVVHVWWWWKHHQARLDAERQVRDLQAAQQQAALQREAQQDALFDSMVEGLLVLDETGRVQVANRAFVQLFGLNNDRRSRTIMEALRLHNLAELVDRLTTEKLVLDYELRLTSPTERWVQVNGAALFNGNGRRHGTILAFHDLTRLKRLENARKEFVANVSHELRTPLSLIKGYAETLLDGAKDNPEVAERFLRTIERNADRLKLLIEDLLTISELESRRVTLNFQTVNLRPIVDKVLEDLKAPAAARKITLVNEIPAIQVSADAVRLEQVFSNLVDNAIKYGRLSGTVTIGAHLPAPTGEGRGADAPAAAAGPVEVFVRDDGPGIPAEALERVFERFYRVDKARSREQGGTGLGLSIVKHIVQAHGGRVWATSELGHGASFFFTLPQENAALQQTLL